MSRLAMKFLASGPRDDVRGSSNTSLDSALVAQEAGHLLRHEDQRVSAALLERISHYNHSRVHRRLSRKRLEGTGKWFLARTDFQAWSDGSGHSSLWCSGIVGSGKTMIVTAVVEAEMEKSRSSGFPVTFFYCEAAQREFLEASRLLESLMKQLLIYLATILKYCPWSTRQTLKSFYETSEVVPDLEDVVEIFTALFVFVPGATYIIDGLDELDHKEASKILNVFRALFQNAQGQKLFISSRKEIDYNIDIINSIPGTVHVSIAPADIEQDIQHYIDSVIAVKMNSYRVLTEDSSLVQRIKACLYNGAKGMFLWVQLQIEALWEDCFTDQDILMALNSLPDDLNTIYERCLQRIGRRNNTIRFATRVLRWVGCASRPLHIDELREAAAFDLSDHMWDPMKIPNWHLLISCCANLVVLDSSDQCVRFAHPSVKQFLSANWHNFEYPFYVQQEQGQLSCGEFCVNYLSFSDFGLQLEKSREKLSAEIASPLSDLRGLPLGSVMANVARLVLPKSASSGKTVRIPIPPIKEPSSGADTSKYKFLTYAVQNWVLETRLISTQSSVWPQFQALVTEPDKSWNTHPWIRRGQSCSHLHGLLGWGARARHIPLIEIILNLDPSYRVREFCNLPLNDGGIPPLHAASRLGYEEVVKLLLRVCKTNTIDNRGWTALHHAARKGHVEIGRLLLDTAEVNIDSLTEFLETPLLLASRSGAVDFVALLLENRADPSLKDGSCISPLKSAVLNQREEVIPLLLSTGVDVKAADEGGSTILHAASRGTSEIIVRQLLSTGADVGARDMNLNTPLHSAAMYGIRSCGKALLDNGAEIEKRNNINETPLLCAVKNKNLGMAQLLLQYAANTEARDKNRLTPLLEAVGSGQEEMVRLLLSHRAEIDASDDYHGTALEKASGEGRLALVQILMDHGAAVNSGSGFYGFPLQAASARGNLHIVEALLEQADPNHYGGHYSFALLAAAVEGFDQIVRLLLKHGAAIDAQGDAQDTALIMAARKGHVQVVETLLQEGADININPPTSGSALYWAASSGSERIVQLLLAKSADVSLYGEPHGTAMQAASFYGHIRVVQMLLNKGADINKRGGRCGTALEAARQQGHSEMVKLLVKKGASPNLKKQGMRHSDRDT